MSAPESQAAPKPKDRVVGATAAIVAAGAVSCGVCCVLPFALPAAVLATGGGVLAWFARLQGWATLLAVVAVVGAWAWVGLQSRRARRDPARSTLITLGLATLLLAAALAWPRIEPMVFGLLRQR